MSIWDILTIALYFLIVIGVGFWYRRKASQDLEAYFLGGRRLHWMALAMSGSVTNFDITGTMWMVSVMYVLGMQSWWQHWMWGVIIPVFSAAFMARWVRRSRVMTAAEWMVTRFGNDAGGRVARYAAAVMAVLFTIGMVGYAFQGIGKFAAVYIPLEQLDAYIAAEETDDAAALDSLDAKPHDQPTLPAAGIPEEGPARPSVDANPTDDDEQAGFFTRHEAAILATAIFALTTLYVVLGGLYSVVVTDVIQTVILTGAALIIVVLAFIYVTPELIEQNVPKQMTFTRLTPTWRKPWLEGTPYDMYHMFGLMTILWVMQGVAGSISTPGGSADFQRHLAASDERSVCKLAAAWPIFQLVRWAMVAGITLLALSGVMQTSDPETVMPMVLHEFLPAGVRGVVIAGLLAAFMSTFSSNVNAGASFVVRDLWQPIFRPDADERHLIRYSYLATTAIVVIGVIIGARANSITEVWLWLLMNLGAGALAPNLLRWYWWRFNGWAYGAGVLGGLLMMLALRFLTEPLPYYISFPVICLASTVASVITAFITPPPDDRTIDDFYTTIRPYGVWGFVKRRTGMFKPHAPSERLSRVVFNIVVGVIGLTGFYLAPMYLIGHWYRYGAICAGVAAGAIVILYFTWYQYLPPPGNEEEQDVAGADRREGPVERNEGV